VQHAERWRHNVSPVLCHAKREAKHVISSRAAPLTLVTCRLGSVVVSVLATGPIVLGFKHGRGVGFLRAIKVRNTPFFGWEVKPEVPCRKILRHVKRSGVRSPAGAEDFSCSLCVQTGSGVHPASCTMGTGGKARPGRDADHSPPSSAEVVNE
jgi:hypothetical protein